MVPGVTAGRLTRCPLLVLALTVALAPAARAVSTGVVISQVYGGGGNVGSMFKNDFIELFNLGSTAVNVTGWTVQYASATGTSWSSTALSGSIPAGGYYLVQEAQGSGGTTNLPTPDAIGTISMSATSAKVALVNTGTALSGVCPSDLSIVDMVGYGSSASCFEGSATGNLSNVNAAIRNSGGCAETDNNSADFTAMAANPRNSLSSHSCQYLLNVTVDPALSGTVTKSPDQATYQHGTPVDLTALPATGYHFTNWTGDVSSTSNPVNVIMDGDKTVVAHFATNPPPGSLVISQVYGGGGNSGADLKNDFIEVFNRGSVTVNVTGWSVQYAPATGSAWTISTLLGSIGPCHYYLIQEGAGGGGTTDLPTPDLLHDIPMNAIAGKVALVNNSVPLSGDCPSDPSIVDMLGYGSASCSETSPTAALDNVTAALRNEGGCDDTGDNASDFTLIGPTPRNSASPANVCSFWLAVDDLRGAQFALGPVAPNPMRLASRVSFMLPYRTEIHLQVLDVQGRAVATLAQGMTSEGRHEVIWDAARDAIRTGVYFIRLQVPGKTLVRTVAVIR